MAVVERAVYFECGYVPPQRGELAFLYLAYLAFGVKHIDVYPFYSEKAVGHGRTRVAGGGHENVQAVACLAVGEIRQQARHEACTNVLEGKRWPVEKFKRMDVVGNFYYRCVESKRVGYDFVECQGRHVGKERARNGLRHFHKRHVLERFEECAGQLGYVFRHVKPAVGGKPACYRFGERCERRGLVCAVI